LPEIIFRTGDLAHLGNDGNYYFHGRIGDMIKVLGYRVELGEIEFQICKIKGVRQCVCVYDETKSIIIAVYVGEAPAKDISAQIREILPTYMLPRKFVAMESLPKLSSGKVDRQAIKKAVL